MINKKLNEEELKRVALWMPKKLYEQLRKYSFSKHQSLAETSRQALVKMFEEIKNK